MATQHKTSLKRSAKAPLRATNRLLGRILYWAPVWLPGMLIAQIVLYGLKPSLAEDARLSVVQKQLEQREARLAEDAALQERNRRMLADEIYRERVRKSIGIQGEKPLELQHDLPLHK